MTGAEALLKALTQLGVDTCFMNPGTSEMHFVAALDRVPEIRPVLALFEGVVTGAADGYARMSGKPAATLLHLGPGLGNGIANLHNARRARTPMINIVGDHATYHLECDAPLTADIEGLARPVSKWVKSCPTADRMVATCIEAYEAAMERPAGVATLIAPSDATWNDAPETGVAKARAPKSIIDESAVNAAAKALSETGRRVLLMAGEALLERGLRAAARIAHKTGAEVFSDTFVARLQRGAGRPKVRRLPYFAEQAEEALAGTEQLILVSTKAPVAFFAYPGKESKLTPKGVDPVTLAEPQHDAIAALEALAEAVGAPSFDSIKGKVTSGTQRPELPTGKLTRKTAGLAIGALLPEDAIVSDESGTSGGPTFAITADGPPHDWLLLTGGSIGLGLPLATGAAVACPDRRVVCLHGDGGAMYTCQALWTQAREKLDVTNVIFSNRAYGILQVELGRVGAGDGGPRAQSMLDISNPELNFASLAESMGVEGVRVSTAEEFASHFKRSLETPGPQLIEAVL